MTLELVVASPENGPFWEHGGPDRPYLGGSKRIVSLSRFIHLHDPTLPLDLEHGI
jgi:hypothetical protein